MSNRACLLIVEQTWGAVLHAMRSLHALGVCPLVAVAGDGAEIYRRSRFCANAESFGTEDGDTLIRSAVDWAAGLTDAPAIPILVFGDRLAYALASAADRLSSRFIPVISSVAVLDRIMDKAEANRIAEREGLEVPPWIEVTPSNRTACELRFPVAVRPAMWGTSGPSTFKISRCDNQHELKKFLDRFLLGDARFIVQEYVESEERDIEFALTYATMNGGDVLACTGRKRRLSRREGGVMAWGQSERIVDVEIAAKRFVSASGAVGCGGIEFIRAVGRLWFVEYNARVEAIHFLSAASGLDIIQHAYNDAIGAERSAQRVQVDAAAWIGSACLERVRSQPMSALVLAKDRLIFATHRRKVRAVFAYDDLGPAIRIVKTLLRRAVGIRT